mgnify:CR=1 FL=1
MKKILIALIMLIMISCQKKESKEIMENTPNRYEKGLENLNKIDGEAGEKVIESLKDVSPDLAKYIIEYAFGDIYNRKELDLKSKEIAVVSALTAMGNARPQLKVHLNAALNVGCTIVEVQEIILQMAAYSGFPSSINGMIALKEVLADRKEKGIQDKEGKVESIKKTEDKSRYDIGAEQLRKLNENQVEILENTFKDISPDLAKYVIEFGFADISTRQGLSLRNRELATIAALTAIGTATSQLKFHIEAGLKIGISKEEIAEVMILMSVYSGFPAAINGTMVLKEVINVE